MDENKMNKYKVNPSSISKAKTRFNSTTEKVCLIEPVLDAGGRNEFALKMGITNFMDGDLNYAFGLHSYYNTVTSFEVIEHLQNPLLYLTECFELLSDKGVLYLTTPVRWIFKGKYHFHEYSKDELLFILEEAGFKDIKIERITAFDISTIGIRPLIRLIRDRLLGQCWFVEAKK